MLISVKWLQKYIPEFQVSNIDKFRYRVDTRLSEVADVEVKGAGLDKLITAEIVSVENHPKSDKLHVCQVNTGSETRTIVCGAPNVRPGMISILCLPGGSVYDHDSHEPMSIAKRPVMGVESDGMLCSPAELGLSTHHEGIIELPAGTIIGQDVVGEFRDTVIEIENKAFPHRPDVFSHLGVAREFSAIFKTKLVEATADKDFIARAEINLPLDIDVRDTDFCPRFSAVTISNVQVKPSPLWLQVALSYCGVRPINNVVDITNYIMMDIGQPMHAFDYQKIDGHKLVVRKAKQDEEITSLDGKKRKLSEQMTVISDADKPQSIAGIMGGADSEISTSTTEIILEAANWEMYQIRRTSRDLGLRSEASTRFEKGPTSSNTVPAITKAANMLLDVAGAEVASDLIDIYPHPEEEKIIQFDLNSIPHLLGVQPTKAELVDILEALGLQILDVEKIPAEAFTSLNMNLQIRVKVPLYRRDLRIAADILEEIARYFGYENFPWTLPERDLKPASRNNRNDQILKAKKALVASGLNEIYTYSMVGEKLYQKALLGTKHLWSIQNPISPELAFVRDSIVPSLLEKAQVNSNKYENFGLFEVSRVAFNEIVDGLPKQPYKLAALYLNSSDESAYRHLKLSIENLSRLYGDRITINRNPRNLPAFLHPGKSGEVLIDNEYLGFIGVLHPQVAENYELGSFSVALYELDLEKLFGLEVVPAPFKPMSKFPAVIRDFSFWVPQGEQMGDLVQALKSEGIDSLESISIIDTYTKDKKTSFTIRIVFQPMDHTLTQEEITKLTDQVNKVAEKLKFETRS
jgi:phenylalanyl-tRNA synthetase beta chain